MESQSVEKNKKKYKWHELHCYLTTLVGLFFGVAVLGISDFTPYLDVVLYLFLFLFIGSVIVVYAYDLYLDYKHKEVGYNVIHGFYRRIFYSFTKYYSAIIFIVLSFLIFYVYSRPEMHNEFKHPFIVVLFLGVLIGSLLLFSSSVHALRTIFRKDKKV